MTGVIVNCITVILGSLIGMIFKKAIPEKISHSVMNGIGLCVIYIGISGMVSGGNVLILITSIIAGLIIGSLIDIDRKLNDLGDYVQSKLSKDGSVSIASGFVTGSLLFCTGAMTIVGSINSGISGDHTLIFAKSAMDFVSSMMLAVSLGFGVLLSSAFVFVFQGAIVLLATYLQPVLTEGVIGEISLCGSVIILALGLNLMSITKIKVANFMPAIFLTPVFYYIAEWIMSLV